MVYPDTWISKLPEEVINLHIDFRRLNMEYKNLAKCGNCTNIVELEKSDTCEVCGMIICGECGKFCKYHQEVFTIFYCAELQVGSGNFNNETLALFCEEMKWKVVNILKFTAFNFVEVI